jgi:GT2 family glycosyltransferase
MRDDGGRAVPEVSVLMPVFNAGRFLEAGLRSIQDQTFGAFEVLAVDDGSVDDSREIMERFAREDPRFRVLVQENGGAASARNLAIGEARAPLLALADADDVSLPDRFRQQVDRFAQDPDLAVLGTGAGIIDEDGALTGLSLLPSSHQEIHEGLLRGDCIYNPSVMMRTEAVRGVGGYRRHLRYAEDYDLFLRMLPARFANLDRALVLYRLHATQMTQRAQLEFAFAARVILESRRTAGSGEDPIDVWSGSPEMSVVSAVTRSPGAELQLCADLLHLIRPGLDAPGPVGLSGELASRARSLASGGFDPADLQAPDRVVGVVRHLWSVGERVPAALFLLRLLRHAPGLTLRSTVGHLGRSLKPTASR